MTTRKVVPAIVLCMMLIGCTSVPVPPKQASKVPDNRVFSFAEKSGDRTAAVQITRDGRVGYTCTVAVALDGEIVALFKVGETTRVWVESGFHVASMDVNNSPGCRPQITSIQFHASNNKTTYIRIIKNFTGGANLILWHKP